MAAAEFHEVLQVDKDKFFDAVVKYEEYPKFVEGCTEASIENRSDKGVRVKYRVQMMSQDVTYTLDHFESPDTGKIEWNLVESNFFKKNSGHWEIKSVGSGKTDVLYSLDVEFKIPVPGFILSRLVKSNLPNMVKSFEQKARKA